MAMGKRKPKQQPMFVAAADIVKTASHPFYTKVDEILDQNKVDRRLEYLCKRFYAPTMGRPSLAPGTYFRMLLIGYFEGIDSERGIAWRVADSLSLREFLGLNLTEETPDHSTMSRTRRLLPVETHKAVFRWFENRCRCSDAYEITDLESLGHTGWLGAARRERSARNLGGPAVGVWPEHTAVEGIHNRKRFHHRDSERSIVAKKRGTSNGV